MKRRDDTPMVLVVALWFALMGASELLIRFAPSWALYAAMIGGYLCFVAVAHRQHRQRPRGDKY
jgi:hypothetical protein